MTRPEDVGLSSQRLSRIETFLRQRYIDPGLMPCGLVQVARRGQVVYECVAGHADVENARPIEPDTIFRIYSMTKPVVSVAFMMLVEEGRIALDDPVARHIPSWADLGVFVAGSSGYFQTRPPERPMQVIDLLRHTSGLTYGFQQRTNVDAAYRQRKIGMVSLHGTLEGMIDELSRLPLEFSPGEAWNYSVSTDVLGYLIQHLSGQRLDEFLRDRIFTPLGMNDTAFHVPDGKLSRFARCYEFDPRHGMKLHDGVEDSPYRRPPSFLSGGGGLVSTASDFMRFCQMMLDGGTANGTRFLSRKTIDLMSANHLPGGRTMHDMSISLFSEAAYAGIGFGLGLAVTEDPARSLLPGSKGEYFWGGMASTAFWIDPVEDLAVVFMTQLIPSTLYPVRRELRTLVYSAFDD